MEAPRRDDLALAIRLSLLTIAWNVVSGAAALVASFASGSISLAGLGFNAVVDSIASAVLVWRFSVESREPDRADRIEHVARLFLGWTLIAVTLCSAALSESVGWESADAVAGLIIAGLLVREGVGSLREES